ncbi:hypothetical protein DRQ17_04710 [bacterium]|uniref:phospholipase D n=1 Tax=candidate division WOR-3 bacterium TaxID=2052148 RepID=A0A7C0ZH16_UNCW3|nr:MAG: hypothetical protein DRQ17_04710 [bacterium]RKZ24085.1 MAG: hypothetical protein DRQ23_01250 [bacterium]HDI82703.1 DUF1669 domain-containing protein [candidate division WOR-3 bacterium]
MIVILLSLIQVFFSPNGGCKDAVLKEINSAKRSVQVAVYLLTDREISNALLNAKERGVDVKVVLDGEQADEISYSKHIYLKKHGVDVRLVYPGKSGKGIMHHKFAVIDKKTLLTGSFNWTPTADRYNHENLLVIKKNKKLLKKFLAEFKRLYKKGVPVEIETKVVNGNNTREVKDYVGRTVYVKGKVYNWHISRKGNLFIDFGKTRKSFTFVMWSEGVKELKKRGFPFEKLDNGYVKVYGKIIDHPKYGLEILTDDPDAIEIVK